MLDYHVDELRDHTECIRLVTVSPDRTKLLRGPMPPTPKTCPALPQWMTVKNTAAVFDSRGGLGRPGVTLGYAGSARKLLNT
jgi:hypothetical protein